MAGRLGATQRCGAGVASVRERPVSIPPLLSDDAESTAGRAKGDGRVFHAVDGGSLAVFGRNDVLHDGIDATAKDIASRLAGRGGRTSYAAGRENWRVVSGTDRAGNIFYIKILRRDDQFAIVALRYPANAPRFRSIATRIGACFAMLN